TGHGTDTYMAARDWACAENDSWGVALAMRDSQLIEFDHIHPDKTDVGDAGEGSAMFAYLANDWLQMHVAGGSHLNFRFRFALLPYAGSHQEANINAATTCFNSPLYLFDRQNHQEMEVDYLTTRSEDGIVSHGLGDWYDYGPWKAGFSRNTPIPLVATAHYIYDLQLITEAARMVGRNADEQKYQALYNQVVDAFNRHFYKPDSCYYGTGSQTSNALPLFLGICGKNKDVVMQSLINDIHAHGDRLTTGDVGNRYLFRVLADNGQNELLFKMLNHYETPGYGFQLKQGATTLTEQWDPRQGSSWNHFMLGQIDEWFFRSLAGIKQKPGTHGMRHLVIEPQSVGNIHHIRASIETLYGKITIDYDKEKGTRQISVPNGCTVDAY
ncbi:MAG: hypothetical protein II063_06200, partial [Prevotella sp.]|nr:hypothetical protein [Prevotella sp.]